MQRYSASVSLFPDAPHRCTKVVQQLHEYGVTWRRVRATVPRRGAPLHPTRATVPGGSASLHRVRVPVLRRSATLHHTRATVARIRSNAAPCPRNSSPRFRNAASDA